jgi:peptidoglycan/xylan/chitin deacetylase (PgdA/CDA1 family)
MQNLFFSLVVLSSFFIQSTYATEVSFTIDDPGLQSTSTLSHLDVARQILQTLNENKLKVFLFVCGKRIDSPEGMKILKLWDEQGHRLGNHTYSHENYNSRKIDFNFLSHDIFKNEALIKNFKNFKKIFRFPMLKEGDTAEKRDDMRTLLKKNGYIFGHVTIDASDWYISDRFVEKLDSGKKINLDSYRDYYLKHIWDRAQYYNNLSKRVLGREVKHNILLHHNPLNAYFLKDLILMFKNKGWKIISAENAFEDPVYSLTPKSLPAGEGIIWGLAKESGKFESELRYPAEDGDYEKDGMDLLGL